MRADIRREPTQEPRQFVMRASVQRCLVRAPFTLASPEGPLKLMLNIEQPYSELACERNDWHLQQQERLDANETDQRCRNSRSRGIGPHRAEPGRPAIAHHPDRQPLVQPGEKRSSATYPTPKSICSTRAILPWTRRTTRSRASFLRSWPSIPEHKRDRGHQSRVEDPEFRLEITVPTIATARLYDNVPGGCQDMLLQVEPALSYAPPPYSSSWMNAALSFAVSATYNQNFSMVSTAAYRGYTMLPSLTIAFQPAK